MNNFLSVAAGVVFCLGFVPYIWGMLRPKVKWSWLNNLLQWLAGCGLINNDEPVRPVRITWFIWTSLDAIILVGMYMTGAMNGQIIAAVFCGLTVFILSLKYGKPGWGWVDIFCLAGAAVGIVLWQWYQDPLWGIVIFLSIVLVGSVPTLVSAWKYPSREDKLAWFIWWISCVPTVASIPRWTLADAGQPIVFFVAESLMVLILFVRPRILAVER